MAGTYGEPGKNTFAVPGVGGILSPVVNDTTGVTQIYRSGAANTYQSLGTFNPTTNKFTASSNATAAERNALSQAANLKTVRDKASETVSRGVQAAGGTPEKGQAAANKLLSPNKANDPGTGTTPPGGSTPAQIAQGEGVKSGEGTRNEFAGQTLRYPEDIANTKQDVVKFTMLEYKPSGLNQTGVAGGLFTVGGARGSDRDILKNRKLGGTVILPIPAGISDTNAANWSAESMNAAQAFAAKAAMDSITQGLSAGAKTISQGAEELSKPAQNNEAGTGLAAVFAAAAAQGDGSQILQRTEGSVINPNMELLFSGPSLRPFTFTFKMSARSKTEGKAIINIIRFFKRGMAPIKSDANLFLKAPNTFKIQYLYRQSEDHPYIGRIKECALQTLTVNYTPEGQYATFSDGYLVSYEMQMQFTELEPVYNSDYEGTDGIGY